MNSFAFDMTFSNGILRRWSSVIQLVIEEKLTRRQLMELSESRYRGSILRFYTLCMKDKKKWSSTYYLVNIKLNGVSLYIYL